MSSFEDRLRRLILEHGPITVARYMTLCLAHPSDGYYPTRDPFGADGDFITAPEISQVFGELIGLALVTHWLELGRPDRVALVELGPGRGTLMADIVRAARAVPGFGVATTIHLVETSPVLRDRQAAALPDLPVFWHDALEGVPDDQPLLLLANEFLDALPIRQFVLRDGRWHERLVGVDDRGEFRFVLAPRATPLGEHRPDLGDAAPDGSVLELGPTRDAFAEMIALRIAAQGGLALLVDYGGEIAADTLRAVHRHVAVDPLLAPGQSDISAHVDFGALATRACARGAAVFGPLTQREFLGRLGLAQRLRQLLRKASPEQRSSLESGCARLVGEEAMGDLFKVLALTPADGPVPPGFMLDERRT